MIFFPIKLEVPNYCGKIQDYLAINSLNALSNNNIFRTFYLKINELILLPNPQHAESLSHSDFRSRITYMNN